MEKTGKKNNHSGNETNQTNSTHQKQAGIR